MRASRLLAILILLQLRDRMTAAALAGEFEVSERTILRDIDALSEAGVPVYATRGRDGGFGLLDGWRTRLTGLTGEETEALTMIGLPGPAGALGLGAAATGARRKLFAAIGTAGLAGAGRMGERFHLDPADWYREEAPATHLPALTRAVLDGRQVALRYESWTGTRDHRLSPLGLVLKGGDWYLVAAKGARIGTYRVATIVRLAVAAEGFERPPDFDLAAHWANSVARFERELRPRTARIAATLRGRQRLAELGAHAARAVAEAGDGPHILLPIESDEQSARQLIGLCDEIEIVEPASLRAAIATLAAAAGRHRLSPA